jgi:hypothetical protein
MTIPPVPLYACVKHGLNAWNGEVVCSNCDRAYTTKDEKSSTHAPPRCVCGARLMPVDRHGRIDVRPGQYYSAARCCSLCFAEKHDRGSAYCLGVECPIHGPMIRKLARRAERAAWAARKSVAAEHVIEIRVPGVVGTVRLHKVTHA